MRRHSLGLLVAGLAGAGGWAAFQVLVQGRSPMAALLSFVFHSSIALAIAYAMDFSDKSE